MKVIIIGAGISGLTLAAALAQLASQHEVELYERDRSPALTSEDPLLSGGYFTTLGDYGDSFFCYTQPRGVHFSYTSHVDPATLESP